MPMPTRRKDIANATDWHYVEPTLHAVDVEQTVNIPHCLPCPEVYLGALKCGLFWHCSSPFQDMYSVKGETVGQVTGAGSQDTSK